jgi:hypothetical protein
LARTEPRNGAGKPLKIGHDSAHSTGASDEPLRRFEIRRHDLERRASRKPIHEVMSLRESIPSSSRRIFMRGIVCNPTTHPSKRTTMLSVLSSTTTPDRSR